MYRHAIIDWEILVMVLQSSVSIKVRISYFYRRDESKDFESEIFDSKMAEPKIDILSVMARPNSAITKYKCLTSRFWIDFICWVPRKSNLWNSYGIWPNLGDIKTANFNGTFKKIVRPFALNGISTVDLAFEQKKDF